MEAIVLAGGLGSRLQRVVQDVPKPMAPVNGRPFLEYLLDYWIDQGVDRFILSVGYKRHVIQEYFAGEYRGIEMDYAVEDQPRGTGGGLFLGLGRLHQSGPFLVVNGDTFFEVKLTPMRRCHQDWHAEITIAMREVDANSRYAGVETDENGRIKTFGSRLRTKNRTLINGGVYLMERSAFADRIPGSDRPISIEEQLYPRLLQSGRRLYGYPSDGRFIDIGIPEDYERAAAVLLRT